VKHFSRLGTLTLIASGALLVPLAKATEVDFIQVSRTTHLLISNSSQGYLGVGLRDVDAQRATALKLKDTRGVEINSVDKDAPAFKSGLRVHDVVVQMNGQHVDGTEQFRRMLHDIPPGRTITLMAVRDGQAQSFSVQLADRTQLAAQVINDLETDPPSDANADASQPIVLPKGSRSSGFFGSLSSKRYYIGVDIQPLPTGLADYFGARNGVLVGNVFSNSPASVAGLRPADVIQKVNGQAIVTLNDWDKAIHANRGKRVQVTIIRERRELTVSMIAGVTKGTSELNPPEVDQPESKTLAELSGSYEGIDADGLANQLRQSMRAPDVDVKAQPKPGQNADDTLIVDANQIDQEMAQTRRLLGENSQQIERRMQHMRNALKSLQLQQMD
jgi:serine protease Do